MACLSPSPSERGRRLSELLQEKQEPFFLDIYLLEKGCSASLLDGYDTTACWPTGADTSSALRRLTSRKPSRRRSKTQPAAGGILRLLLSKILHGKAANRKPAALPFSDSFKKPAAIDTVMVSKDEEEEEDDGAKQLSPVSVLEHPFESSLVHGEESMMQESPKKAALEIFRELLDAGYTPALLDQLLSKSDELIGDHDGGYNIGNPEKSCSDKVSTASAAAAYWESCRAELAKVTELIASEMPASARVEAADVRPEREHVAGAVEAAIFEELLVEFLGAICTVQPY